MTSGQSGPIITIKMLTPFPCLQGSWHREFEVIGLQPLLKID
jgi:hypothetical protein